MKVRNQCSILWHESSYSDLTPSLNLLRNTSKEMAPNSFAERTHKSAPNKHVLHGQTDVS